jgi:hypothetical protein
MTGADLLHDGNFSTALFLGLETTGMEDASGGGIQRARDFSLEDNRGPLGFHEGIRYGYRG